MSLPGRASSLRKLAEFRTLKENLLLDFYLCQQRAYGGGGQGLKGYFNVNVLDDNKWRYSSTHLFLTSLQTWGCPTDSLARGEALHGSAAGTVS